MASSATVKIIAVVAVVVIAVSAVAVVFATNNNKSSDPPIESYLMVRGNADNNYTMDSKDMEILDDIIAEKKFLKDYPLADVNNDGKVDSTDKAILQDMLDHKEGITMYVQTLDRNGKVVTQEVKYPLRNIVTFATNMEMPCLYAGGGQYTAGYFSKSYATAEASVASTAVKLGADQRTIKDEHWTNFTNLDADLASKGGIGAFLVDYSGISQITAARENDLKEAGIPMLAYKSADAMVEAATVITLSYLFGEETEPIGIKYAQLADKVIDKVRSKVGDLSEDKRSTYMCFTMYIYICQNDSTFNTAPSVVYGNPYYNANSEFKTKYTGTGSTIMATTEALSNYTDVDVLINNRSIDWQADSDAVKSMIVETWEHNNKKSEKTTGGASTAYFKGFEDKLNYINNLLPGPAKMAYIAAALYGDEFSFDWADEILQECIDMGLIPLKNQTVEKIVPYFDKAKYEAAKA